MDLELKKGFQELQAQVLDTRAKIANIDACFKMCTHDAKVNHSIIQEFEKEGSTNYLYEPVGRMLVKREGEDAHKFLQARSKLYEENLRQYKEVKEFCLTKVKDSQNSLRELVNRKLNKQDQPSKTEEKVNPSSTAKT